VEKLAVDAARDFEEFYATREAAAIQEQERSGALLVLSTDGKGICMRPEGLREATRKAAEKRAKEPGPPEKSRAPHRRHAKRMATVATVYNIEPYVRTPEDIVRNLRGVTDGVEQTRRPRPQNKRVWASIVEPADKIIRDAFDEGLRRDPKLVKRWVALVDGNEPQLDALEQQAKVRGFAVTIIVGLTSGRLRERWAATLHESSTNGSRNGSSYCSGASALTSPPVCAAAPPCATCHRRTARPATTAPITCSSISTISATTSIWRLVYRSLPASLKALVVTSSRIGWASPALAGVWTAQRTSCACAPPRQRRLRCLLAISPRSRTSPQPHYALRRSTPQYSPGSSPIRQPQAPPPARSLNIIAFVPKEPHPPVFLLDEAHLLHQDTLDHLHILLNYEWDSKAFLSLVLVGLSELDDRLALRRNRSLASRLHHRFFIGPLTPDLRQAARLKHRLVERDVLARVLDAQERES
jgi:hypothetical protein